MEQQMLELVLRDWIQFALLHQVLQNWERSEPDQSKEVADGMRPR